MPAVRREARRRMALDGFVRTSYHRHPLPGVRSAAGLRLLEKVDYAPYLHSIDPKATAWAAANLTQLVVSMWNRQANDAKDMRASCPAGKKLLADARRPSVGEMEWEGVDAGTHGRSMEIKEINELTHNWTADEFADFLHYLLQHGDHESMRSWWRSTSCCANWRRPDWPDSTVTRWH